MKITTLEVITTVKLELTESDIEDLKHYNWILNNMLNHLDNLIVDEKECLEKVINLIEQLIDNE